MKRLTHLAIGAAFLLAVAACGDDDSGGGATATTAGAQPATTEAAAPTTQGDAGTTTTPSATSAPTDTTGVGNGETAGGATVQVAEHPQLGQYLVDADGRTLYLFEQDQGTTTACTADCAEAWPPLAADEPMAGEGVDESQLGTSQDGIVTNQVAYHGHLLYYFATDVEPGQIEGTTIPAWYAVTPAGEAIHLDGQGAGTTTTGMGAGGGGY